MSPAERLSALVELRGHVHAGADAFDLAVALEAVFADRPHVSVVRDGFGDSADVVVADAREDGLVVILARDAGGWAIVEPDGLSVEDLLEIGGDL